MLEEMAILLKKISEPVIKVLLGLYIIGAIFMLWWRGSVINVTTPIQEIVFDSIFPIALFILMKTNRFLVSKKTSGYLIASMSISALPIILVVWFVMAQPSVFRMFDYIVSPFR